MKVSDMIYDVFFGTTQGVGTFIQNGDAGIADLRSYSLSPGQSIKIVYRGSLQSFSFGTFDVGYLEDKNDPNLNSTITADQIKTINPKVSSLTSIPEKDFYNHDVFGDIRFNPNETCGGPALLWRSHNTYDRTYHKTLIVRDIADPDAAAVEA